MKLSFFEMIPLTLLGLLHEGRHVLCSHSNSIPMADLSSPHHRIRKVSESFFQPNGYRSQGLLGSSSICIIVISLSLPVSIITANVIEILRSTLSLFLHISESDLDITTVFSVDLSTQITTILTLNSSIPKNSSFIMKELNASIDGNSMTTVLAEALSHSPTALLNASLALQYSSVSLKTLSVQILSTSPTLRPTPQGVTTSIAAMEKSLAPQSIALIVIFSVIGLCILSGLMCYCSHEISKNRRVSIEGPLRHSVEEQVAP